MRLDTDFMRDLLRGQAPHIAYSSIALSEIQRQGVRALYTFFRIARDTVDKAASKTESQLAVDHLVRLFDDAQAYDAINEIPDLGLAREAWLGLEEEFDVPRIYALEFARGLRMEADSYRPESIDDLLTFCYHTGGILGLIVCHILNVPEAAMQSLVDAGSAARLTSLSTDLKKDFELGRCFVPLQWFSRAETARLTSAWSAECRARFDNLASILYNSSRNAYDFLPLATRLALSASIVLHREGRASRVRKFDNVIDELLRQCGSALRKTWIEKFDSKKDMFANPYIKTHASARLPQRGLSFALRNQSLRISRAR